MPLDAGLVERLLTAIENNTLIFLLGAGLSIPAPSNLPAAKWVAENCYGRRAPLEALPAHLREDVDALATHFHAKGEFRSVFIPLVPWNELLGQPNAGHAAVADLLITRSARAALSANFDVLVEAWAQRLKVDMRAALSGQEAVNLVDHHNTFLKFHGCMQRAREETLWSHAQLSEASVADRLESCKNWMTLNLPGKDLLIVGFWSDWRYLNDILAAAFTIGTANSVTVFDPGSAGDLQVKAPQLWDKLNALSAAFQHVPVSGAEALEELRKASSAVWVRRFYSLADPLIAEAGGPAIATPDLAALGAEDLYALRQDGEGVPYSRAATSRAPVAGAAEAAFLRKRLLGAGAVENGSWLEHHGRSLRVVNGAGRPLNGMKGDYLEPVSAPQADWIICAGSVDVAVPARIIPTGIGASTVRPAAGGTARWLTTEEALAELSL